MMFSGGNSNGGTHPQNLDFTLTSGNTLRGYEKTANAMYSNLGDLGYWLNKAKCSKFPTYSAVFTEEYCGVFFGAGATPATTSDFKLESPIESGLNITNPSKYTFKDDGEGKWTYSADYVVQNNSGAEINLHEVGIVTYLGSSSTEFYPVLMERTVLETPVTIPAGEARLIEYKVTFHQS